MAGLGAGDYQGGRNVGTTVTDPALLALGREGADRFCAYCGAGNRASATACARCGGTELVDERPKNPPGAPDDDPLPLTPSRPRRKKGRRFLLFAVAAAVVFGGYRYWATRTHDLAGTVSAMSWRHDTVRQRWVQVTRSDWRDSLHPAPAKMPVDGKGERPGVEILPSTCQEKFHHTEQYACGTENVCSEESYQVQTGETCSESCTDNGNGFATCTEYCSPTYSTEHRTVCRDETKYCDRDIFETWCSYRTWEWTDVETKTVAGSSKQGTHRDIAWAALTPGALERIAKRSQYEVVVDYRWDDARLQERIQPRKLGQEGERPDGRARDGAYLSWTLGEEVVVEKQNNGDVAGVWRGKARDDPARRR